MTDSPATHFPRPDLAREVLARMAEAPRRPLVLTGAAGIGKSVWLKHDLVPMARACPWWPIVIDVTEPRQADAVIVDTLRSTLSGLITPTPSDLEGLLEAVRQAASPAPVLLMLDGAAGWTSTTEGSAALGTLLVQLGRLATGVSVLLVSPPGPTLAKLIEQHSAAGLALSPPVEIPPLGEPFLDFVETAGAHAQVLERLPREEQRRVFDQLLMRPGEYLAFLDHWQSTHADWPPERALARYRAQSPVDRSYAQAFMRATPLQQQLLVAIAQGRSELFSVDSRQRFSSALGSEALVTVSDVDAQLKRLEARQWIVRIGATPARFADDGFALWVRALAGE